MEHAKLKEICEVLIFASDTPITTKQIQDVVEEAKPKQIEKAINALMEDYRETRRTFTIVQVAGGYQMVSHDAYAQWIRKLFHRKIKSRLSQAALEALSVIAFKQPISKPEVEGVRGVNCDGVVKTLLERKLITMAGRGDGPGKPLLYKTTSEFLRYFGINDISDLPKPREIEEILKEAKKPDEVDGLEALNTPADQDVENPSTDLKVETENPESDAAESDEKQSSDKVSDGESPGQAGKSETAFSSDTNKNYKASEEADAAE